VRLSKYNNVLNGPYTIFDKLSVIDSKSLKNAWPRGKWRKKQASMLPSDEGENIPS
jgi:hypothetical protein